MGNINWKQKLASRKLWAAIAAVAITILTALFKTELTAEAVTLIEKGVIALCVYICGEGIVDAARQIWSHAIGTELLDEATFELVEDEAEEQPVDSTEYEK